MDPLSEVLALLKPQSYITAGFDAGGRWALLLDDLGGRIKCYTLLKGCCWLSVDGHDTSVHLTEGDCFVLPSGRNAVIASDLETEPMRASDVLDPNRSGEVVTYNGGGSAYLVGTRFEVNGRHADGLLRTLPPLLQVRASNEQTKLRLLLDLMMQECHEKRPGAFLVMQHLSHMVLTETLRLYMAENSRHEVSWLAALADPQLCAAITAMHSDPAFAWSLSRLAAKANMSRAAFAKAFRERVGETPISYVTRWRMTLAAEMLIRGKSNLADVADKVGYTSEHAFNTAFRRIMGCSPRRYARQERQAQPSR